MSETERARECEQASSKVRECVCRSVCGDCERMRERERERKERESWRERGTFRDQFEALVARKY